MSITVILTILWKQKTVTLIFMQQKVRHTVVSCLPPGDRSLQGSWFGPKYRRQLDSNILWDSRSLAIGLDFIQEMGVWENSCIFNHMNKQYKLPASE